MLSQIEQPKRQGDAEGEIILSAVMMLEEELADIETSSAKYETLAVVQRKLEEAYQRAIERGYWLTLKVDPEDKKLVVQLSEPSYIVHLDGGASMCSVTASPKQDPKRPGEILYDLPQIMNDLDDWG